MPAPLLTIVTVTKDCAATLEKTLRSVLAVKNADIEYIVIDGVSTDGTLDLLARYEGLVDQLVSEPDTGIYNAMNKGVSLAKGAYILFINGDDELLAPGFSAVERVLREGGGEIVCAITLVGSVATPSETLAAQPWRLPFYNSIPHPSTFVATSLLKQYRFREDLRIASDYDLFLRLFLARHRFVQVNAVTALHMRGGASGNSELSQAEIEQIRRERLGWAYPLANAVRRMHGWNKVFRENVAFAGKKHDQ
ncbi:MAG: glycosyltransferase family 2 protein [Thiobacillus sp.]|nr:glycosyltransferase family 2 protein [Thiobacillus sp.]